jgi:transcriptional regulator with XRE-family HTH domain
MEVKYKMGNNPTKAAENIYFQARKEAAKHNDKLNSREGAAELLGLSVSSLSDYELGLTKVVPVDKVMLMADLYNAPEIKAQYCNEFCPLGCKNTKIVLEDLDRVSLQLISVAREFAGEKDNLLNIVEDGVISDDEKAQLDRVLSVLDKTEASIKRFKLWAEKNIRPVP